MVSWPRAEAHRQDANSRWPGTSEGRPKRLGEPGKVLVVEDEAFVALEICDYLTELGLEVVGLAATEGAAVQKAREHNPDLVLMDIKLKHGGNGLNAAKEIAASSDACFLFITAFNDSEIENELGKWPSGSAIFKPFGRSALQHAVKTALARVPLLVHPPC